MITDKQRPLFLFSVSGRGEEEPEINEKGKMEDIRTHKKRKKKCI